MHGVFWQEKPACSWATTASSQTYQDGNTPGASATEGLNTPILQAQRCHSPSMLRRMWPWVTFTYRRAAGVLLCPGPGAVAHWAVSHHLLDHRQENLASRWPDRAESWYAFSPLPSPSKDKRSFRPKETCPHWLEVTLIQLLGCTPGREPKPFLAGLQATAIWRGRNNSAVKELIN